MDPKTIKITAGVTVGALIAIVLASGGDEKPVESVRDAGVAEEPDAPPPPPPKMDPQTARQKFDVAMQPAVSKRALAAAVKSDEFNAAYNGVIEPMRKADPQLVDMDAMLDPGESVVREVNFYDDAGPMARGGRFVADGGMPLLVSNGRMLYVTTGDKLEVQWQSEPVTIGHVACEDQVVDLRTHCEFQVTNNTDAARRAVFLVRYEIPGAPP